SSTASGNAKTSIPNPRHCEQSEATSHVIASAAKQPPMSLRAQRSNLPCRCERSEATSPSLRAERSNLPSHCERSEAPSHVIASGAKQPPRHCEQSEATSPSLRAQRSNLPCHCEQSEATSHVIASAAKQPRSPLVIALKTLSMHDSFMQKEGYV